MAETETNQFVPRISIITLALKMEKTLLQTAISVLNSSATEIIIVNPDANSEIEQIAFGLRSRYGSRVVLVSESDESPAEGLNHGLARCSGEIIGVLNGDDFYLPGGLDHVIEKFISDPQLDVLIGSGLLVDEEKHVVKYIFPFCKTRFINRLAPLGAITFFHQGIFYRTKAFGTLQFNEQNPINWDYEQYVQMLAMKPNITFTPKILAGFRINQNTISGSGKYSTHRKPNQLRIACILGPKFRGPLFVLIANFFRVYKFVRSITFSIRNQFMTVNLR